MKLLQYWSEIELYRSYRQCDEHISRDTSKQTGYSVTNGSRKTAAVCGRQHDTLVRMIA